MENQRLSKKINLFHQENSFYPKRYRKRDFHDWLLANMGNHLNYFDTKNLPKLIQNIIQNIIKITFWKQVKNFFEEVPVEIGRHSFTELYMDNLVKKFCVCYKIQRNIQIPQSCQEKWKIQELHFELVKMFFKNFFIVKSLNI